VSSKLTELSKGWSRAAGKCYATKTEVEKKTNKQTNKQKWCWVLVWLRTVPPFVAEHRSAHLRIFGFLKEFAH